MDREFEGALQANKTVSRLEKRIRDGKGTLKDASKLAKIVGEVAAEIIGERLQEEYADGKIPRTEVRRIVSPIAKDAHEYAADVTAVVIDGIYQKMGVGLKAVRAEYDTAAENELVTEISSGSFEDGFTW